MGTFAYTFCHTSETDMAGREAVENLGDVALIRSRLLRRFAPRNDTRTREGYEGRRRGSYRACWIAERIQRLPGDRTNVHSSVAVTCSSGLPSTMRPVLSRVTSIIEKRMATVAYSRLPSLQACARSPCSRRTSVTSLRTPWLVCSDSCSLK